MSTVFLFTGENTYALHRELLRWKSNFKEKHGLENLAEFEASKLSLQELLDAVSSMPFIAEKRLVIIFGIPKIDKDEWKKVENAIHPQTVLAFVDAKPDKRLSFVKILLDAADVKLFPLLSRGQIIFWMKETARSLKVTMSDAALSELLEVAGDDQWVLEQELKKIALYCGEREASVTDVRLLAVPSGEQAIWKLTDLIGCGRPEEALAFVAWKIERGEDAYGMWTILLHMVKNLALVWAHSTSGIKDERSIASGAGIHFLAVRNLLPLAKNLPKSSMEHLIDWAASADIQLKSGGYRYTAERQEEVVALTEQLILKCRR